MVRQDDPAEWCELAHSDVALVTQVDDGTTPPGQPGRYPTSSISQPSLVAMMLARTQLAQDHRVLEIGTGTGYNAALLAHRLGAAAVTSVEIDPALAAARVALGKTGFGAVTVITGDGALGHPPGDPYDRVLSTATCHTVPGAWIEQTRPGGRIVTPWASSYHNGALLHLDVTDDGAVSGRFGGNVSSGGYATNASRSVGWPPNPRSPTSRPRPALIPTGSTTSAHRSSSAFSYRAATTSSSPQR